MTRTIQSTCSYSAKQWSSWLPMAEWWFNTTFHSSLQTTLYKILYWHDPIQSNISATPGTNIAAVEDMLTEKRQQTEILKENLAKARQRIKSDADKGRTERRFNIGD